MITGKRIAILFCAAMAMAASANVASASGEQRWIPGVPRLVWGDWIHTPVVFAMTTFDDGSGPALYVGGWIYSGGGATLSGLGRWNGQQWSQVGVGFEGTVTAMTVFDDGSGPALYVAGDYMSLLGGSNLKLAKWDGKVWTALHYGNPSPHIVETYALQVYSDGRTNSLYAAGYFQFGKWPDGIARWNGADWERVGKGLSFPKYPVDVQGNSLTVHDDGAGPQLYVSGWFDHAGDAEALGVARWNGQSWSAAGSGDSPIGANSMTTYVDESNTKWLLAVRWCCEGIYAWNGTIWTTIPFQAGLRAENPTAIAFLEVGTSRTLFVYDSDYGESLRWDGSQWRQLGGFGSSGCGSFFGGGALASFDDGSGVGPVVFVGGQVDQAGGYSGGGVARWGIPKNPSCAADIYPEGGDARVNTDDLVSVITAWGACSGPCNGGCAADIDGNCVVDIDDLVGVITRWGPQPGSIWVSPPCQRP